MRLKQLPDDFRVEEISTLPLSSGPHAVYRLDKRDMTTFDAIDAIARAYDVGRRQIVHAGLKDKRARTVQTLTIENGPAHSLDGKGYDLNFLGFSPRSVRASDISGNRFIIVVRDLDQGQLGALKARLDGIGRFGVPNYFDAQRFGSVGVSNEFVGRAWCEKNHERALWLGLADENPRDDGETRAIKEILRRRWGQWAEAKAELPRSSTRSTITYLADHPTDFKGALARVDREVRGLWLSAYQSFLWNRWLAAIITMRVPESARVDLPFEHESLQSQAAMRRPAWLELDPENFEYFSQMRLPLPSARVRAGDAALESALQTVMHEEGLPLARMRIREKGNSFFSAAERSVLLRPIGMSHDSEPDSLHAGRIALTLRFDLPRGAYATLITAALAATRA